MLAKLLGANWKTSLTAAGTALFASLTFISGISYDVSPLSLVVPPDWKPFVIKIAGGATVVLWIWNGIQQKSKEVTGGSIAQDENNAVAKPQPKIPDPPKAAVPKSPKSRP